MSVFSPAARLAALAAATVAAVVVVGAQGCSKSSAIPGVHTTPSPGTTPSPSPLPSGSPTPTPSPTPLYFVAIAYAVATPTDVPTFGPVDGMSLIPGPVVSPTASANPYSTPGPSSIIAVNAGQKIRFYNYDADPHTASNNGIDPIPGATWPATFNNVNGASNSSAPGSLISDTTFSTGNLIGGSLLAPTASADYFTGSPGMYFMADFYTYNAVPPAVPLRTIFIVF
ncbi:MAG TPA: hypothetical protein VII69_13165 [Candidatus Eremiobacteraceae bacterium]